MFDARLPIFILAAALAPAAHATSATEFEQAVNGTLKRIYVDVPGAAGYLIAAKGILVFPRIHQADAGAGSARGEGAMRVYGWTVDHYNAEGAAAGLQLDAGAKSVVIIFTDQKALDRFRQKNEWQVGADGAVTMVDVGNAKPFETNAKTDQIVGFVFGRKGLMQGLKLDGAKFSRMQKK